MSRNDAGIAVFESRVQRDSIEALVAQAYHIIDEIGPVCHRQAARAEALFNRLVSGDAAVAVIGQFKRGKSSVSNALLGEEILPVGIVPVTSIVTRVVYGESGAEVRFLNGEARKVAFDELEGFISEQKNRGNSLGIKEVVISTPSEFLKSGITFIDTPGVGSFHRNNTVSAYEQMKDSDVILFLLSVDSPINEIEIELLRSAEEFAGKMFFLVNKTDLVSEEELAEYMDYCRSVLASILPAEAGEPGRAAADGEGGTPADGIRLFAVCAKTGEGIPEVREAVTKELSGSIRRIMENSSARKLSDIIDGALMQMAICRAGMSRDHRELDEAFRSINEFMDAEISAAEAEDERRKGLTGMTARFQIPYEILLNEAKQRISARVSELFDVEYSFDIVRAEGDPAGGAFAGEAGLGGGDASFAEEVRKLCSEVREDLSGIMLYKEDNAFTVVRRIEDMNKAARRLRSIKNTAYRRFAAR